MMKLYRAMLRLYPPSFRAEYEKELCSTFEERMREFSGPLALHGPDGVDYKNKIVYIEIVKPERLVYSHVSGPQFHVTVSFAEQGDKTEITVRMLFESATQRDKVVKEFGAIEGLNQTLDRLEKHLAKM